MMMNCQQATRLLSEAMDREVSLQERAVLKLHVMMCSGCRNFGKQMGTLRGIATTYAKDSAEEGSSEGAHGTSDTTR